MKPPYLMSKKYSIFYIYITKLIPCCINILFVCQASQHETYSWASKLLLELQKNLISYYKFCSKCCTNQIKFERQIFNLH